MTEIVPKQAEALLSWQGLLKAFEAGHKLPLSDIKDMFLYRIAAMGDQGSTAPVTQLCGARIPRPQRRLADRQLAFSTNPDASWCMPDLNAIHNIDAEFAATSTRCAFSPRGRRFDPTAHRWAWAFGPPPTGFAQRDSIQCRMAARFRPMSNVTSWCGEPSDTSTACGTAEVASQRTAQAGVNRVTVRGGAAPCSEPTPLFAHVRTTLPLRPRAADGKKSASKLSPIAAAVKGSIAHRAPGAAVTDHRALALDAMGRRS